MTIEDWTNEECNDVLQFYGLDSLEPTEWIDVSTEKTFLTTTQPSKSAIKGESSAEELLTTMASLDSARQLLREDYDPLELKDKLFVRQLLQSKSSIFTDNGEAEANSENINNDMNGRNNHFGSIILTSLNFDPKILLKELHSDTSFSDLKRGRDNLENSCHHRKEVLKNLVKQNFDRFVNAKNSTEIVFKDMQQRRLIDSDHGMRKAIEVLGAAYTKAQEVYGEMVARRERELVLKKKLELFEQFSFIFSLGHRMEKAIKIGEYQRAVNDYKKAKSMINETASKYLKEMLEQIQSGHVGRTLSLMRSDLQSKLFNPVFNFEVHSKILDFLIDLDTFPDPISTYFEQKRKDILAQIDEITLRCNDEIRNVIPTVDTNNVHLLVSQLIQGRSQNRISNLNVEIVKCWKIRCSFFYSFANLFHKFFTDFIKFINALVSGRFGRDLMSKSSEIDNFEGRINNFADEFKSHSLKVFYSIFDSDLLLAQNRIQEDAVIALHYIMKLTPAFGKIINIINECHVSSLVGSVQSLLRDISTHFLQFVWRIAKNNCSFLLNFEALSSTNPNQVCFSKALISDLESLMTTLVEGSSRFYQISMELLSFESENLNIDEYISDCLSLFMDELLKRVSEAKFVSEQAISTIDLHIERLTIAKLSPFYQMLIILTNLIELRKETIPFILDCYQRSVLPTFKESAKSNIITKLDEVEEKIKQKLLSSRRDRIFSLVRTGLLNSGFDWSSDLKTFNEVKVRPFILMVLLELVSIQTQIKDVSVSLLIPLMTPFVTDIFQEILRCVQMIRKFGNGGHFQAYLELKFLQSKLITIMNKEAMEIYEATILTIDEGCPSNNEDVKMEVEKLIREADENTKLSFSCFQYT